MKELKIDVDNLCSFMPQDKVGNFTQQTPQGILQKTLEAITSNEETGKTLHDIQKDLGAEQQAKDLYVSRLEAKVKTLDKYAEELSQMEGDVQRLHARRDNQQMIEMLKAKLLQLESIKQKEVVVTLNNELQGILDELEEKQESIAPLESYERDIKKKIGAHDKASEALNDKLKATDTLCKQHKKSADEKDEELANLAAELKNSAKNRQKTERERAECVKTISRQEQQLRQSTENVPKLEAKLAELSESIKEKEERMHSLQDAQMEAQEVVERINTELNSVNREMKNIKDPFETFKRKLQQDHNTVDDVKLMDYVQKEKANIGFEKDVLGPIGVYLNFKDPIVACIAEKAIGQKKLLAYIVQCNADEQKLRRMNRAVQIFNITNLNPPGRPFSSAALKETLIPGLVGYLTDHIECPPIVRAFLLDQGSLNSHFFAKTDSHGNIKTEHFENLCPNRPNAPKFFTLCVAVAGSGRAQGSLQIHSGQRSKYNQANLTSKSESHFLETRLLQCTGDDSSASAGATQALEKKLAALKKEHAATEESHKTCQRESAKARDEIGSLSSTRKDLAKKLKEPETFRQQIARLKSDLKRHEEMLAKDPAVENRQTLKRRRDTIHGILDSVTGMTKAIMARGDLDNQFAVELECIKALEKGSHEVHESLNVARESLTTLKTAKKNAERRRDEAKAKLDECNENLKQLQLAQGKERGGFREFWARMLDATKDYADVDTVGARIAYLQAQVDNVYDNDNVLVRYNDTKAKHADLRREVELNQDEEQRLHDSIHNRMKKWKEQVDAVTEKLNAQFGVYMSDLGYEGEVELREKGNVDSFEMQMKVSFHNAGSDILTDLSGLRHSGGERAVSTIMYLMALQEMTHAPFRAVDEINQGMDERNERLVFDRIVKSCCDDKNKPQYFLVSPKLLQGLLAMSHDDVTVLMVWNGPGIVNKFKFSELVDRFEAVQGGAKRGRGNDDDEEPHGGGLLVGQAEEKDEGDRV